MERSMKKMAKMTSKMDKVNNNKMKPKSRSNLLRRLRRRWRSQNAKTNDILFSLQISNSIVLFINNEGV